MPGADQARSVSVIQSQAWAAADPGSLRNMAASGCRAAGKCHGWRVAGWAAGMDAGERIAACLQAVLISLRGTPCRRENGVGLPADAGVFSGICEPVNAVWRRGPTWKGHALLLRARRSEFRFPTEAPGQPRFILIRRRESAGDDGTAGDRG